MNFGQAQRTAREEWDRLRSGDTPVISVGTATCGRSAGALDTLDVLRGELAGRDLACRFVEVGCLGPCYAEPLVTVSVPGKATVCFGSVDIRGARKIAAYVAGGDLPALKQTSLEYAALLRQHIQKEDKILFPMGQDCLEAPELEALRRGFDEVEQEGQYHARYTKVAGELLAEVGIDA